MQIFARRVQTFVAAKFCGALEEWFWELFKILKVLIKIFLSLRGSNECWGVDPDIFRCLGYDWK